MRSTQISCRYTRITPVQAKNVRLRIPEGSILSRRSYRSILSYASTGSILSIGSVGSILSITSAGSILGICWQYAERA